MTVSFLSNAERTIRMDFVYNLADARQSPQKRIIQQEVLNKL